MRVTVVVCTFNRAEGLRETLQCLGRQRYGDLEVVVVNGPSTDHTVTVLAEFQAMIRVEQCDEANLAKSRNIGIRSASGEIVAFIDDDALPEFNWLNQAVSAFDEPDVAGVGGIVFDHTGMALQYRYSAANRFAEPTASDDAPYDDYSTPGSFTFPYLQGTNALFRREVLLRLGGFDETYDYYLDETDLCCRIVDAGYILRQLPNAAVHHKFLPSGIRNHQRVVTNWYPIVKNHVYFSYRHALGAHTEEEVLNRSRRFIEHVVNDASVHESAGRLPAGATAAARETVERALTTGIELGSSRQETKLPPLRSDGNSFLRYTTLINDRPLRFVIVSEGVLSGPASELDQHLGHLAQTLASMGHEARLITRSELPSTVDLEGGVWVHRLCVDDEHSRDSNGPTHTTDFGVASAREIARISKWAPVDIVYGLLCHLETAGTATLDE